MVWSGIQKNINFAANTISMSKTISYTEAFEELQQIVQELESSEINVDELSKKIKRANSLLKICQDKLSKVEEDVNEIIEELKS